MRVLFLAPQPFFIPRGTPIAIANLLKALEGLIEGKLLTLPYGDDLEIPFEIERLDRLPFTKIPPPGFSLTKLFYDISMWEEAVRQAKHFDIIHAVEEANFMALFIKKVFGKPYIYDMDSIMSEQLRGIKSKLAASLEKKALKNALAVVAVSPSLADYARKFNSNVYLLPDTPYFQEFPQEDGLKKKFGWNGKFVFLYAGNFSPYQGVEFLIRAFQKTENKNFLLVLVGGNLDLEDPRIKVYPPVPPDEINTYIMAADVLLSPRLFGKNTPMKIYSYLAAEKPILASAIESHIQVLTNDVAMLLPLDEDVWKEKMELIARDETLRSNLSKKARELFLKEYSWERFRERARKIYTEINKKIREETKV